MATRSDDIDMARRALDLADSWGSVDLDAGQIVELATALRDAWRLGRTSANEHRDVLEAAHALRLLGCEGESAVEVMVDAARQMSLPDGYVAGTISAQAWALARAIEGANGGRARELIRDALRTAWGDGRHSTADRLESLERGAERCFQADMTPEEHQESAEAYQRDILEAAPLGDLRVVVTDLKARLDEATRLLGLATKDYDAHAVAAEELRGMMCHGESAVDVMVDAVRLLGKRAVSLDAHSECAEELREVGCAGETTVEVMSHAVERLKRAVEAEAEQNRVIVALAKRADTLQNELGVAEHTLASIRDELRETNVLRRDSHSRLRAVRDAVRED